MLSLPNTQLPLTRIFRARSTLANFHFGKFRLRPISILTKFDFDQFELESSVLHFSTTRNQIFGFPWLLLLTFLQQSVRNEISTCFALSESDRARDRKLFLWLPRMLFHRFARGGNIPLLRFYSLPVGRFTPPESAVFRTVCSFDSQTRLWSNSENCHQGGTLLKELR